MKIPHTYAGRSIFVLISLLPLMLLSATAGTLTVVNSGFEAGNLSGWSSLIGGGYNSGAWAVNNVTDQGNPYPNFSNPLPGTASGTYYAALQGCDGNPASSIYQDVSANGQGNLVLQPNTVYTLTVSLGVGRYNTPNNAIASLVNGTGPGGAVLASADMATLGLGNYANNFKDLVVTCTTGTTVSGDLTIVISTTHGYPGTQSTAIDNVRLSSQSLGVGEGITPVGVDIDRGEFLRTTTSAKPLDGDGNNVYGSLGYIFFAMEAPGGASGWWSSVQSPASNKTMLPSFVSGIGLASGANFAWGYGYALLDDPTLTPSTSVANLESGVVFSNAGGEQNLITVTLSGTVPANFRLGIVTDCSSPGETPSTLRVTSSNGTSSPYFGTTPGNYIPDVYFFNVSGAHAGDVLTIKAAQSVSNEEIAGLVFDAGSTVPPTLTQLLTGATLTLNEDFTGTSLNSAIWNTGMRWTGGINDELEAYRPENVSVANGVCTFTTSKKSGSINHAGGYPIGTTVLAVDGFNFSIPNGSTVSLHGINYTVASTVGGNAPTQITLTSTLTTAVADNDRIGTLPMISGTGVSSGAFEYGSGAIQTYGKFTQAYGYFEARLKMSGGAGTWPAFWLVPDRGAQYDDYYRTTLGSVVYYPNGSTTSCPMGNEIDVFEYMATWKNAATGLSKTHAGYFWSYPSGAWSSYALVDQLLNPDTQFHTYGVLWQPGVFSYYVDGSLIMTRTDPTYVATCPHYLILNCAVSHNDWTSTYVTSDSIDAAVPSTMVIDYVKAYTLNAAPNQIVPAGVDIDRGEFMRTTTSAKPLDADGNNVYGSAGYIFFAMEAPGGASGWWTSVQSPASNKAALPSFVSGVGLASGANFAWGYGYALLDDPTLTPSASVANLESGVVFSSAGGEQNLVTVTLSGTVPSNFRLGIVTDCSSPGETPSTLRVTSSSGISSSAVSTTTGNRIPDVYFFNVSGAHAGDVLTIKATQNVSNEEIAGLVFDVAP